MQTDNIPTRPQLACDPVSWRHATYGYFVGPVGSHPVLELHPVRGSAEHGAAHLIDASQGQVPNIVIVIVILVVGVVVTIIIHPPEHASEHAAHTRSRQSHTDQAIRALSGPARHTRGTDRKRAPAAAAAAAAAGTCTMWFTGVRTPAAQHRAAVRQRKKTPP
jgi:hypothetical protein